MLIENNIFTKAHSQKIATLLFILLASLHLNASGTSQEQADVFLQAVWKEPPPRMDVTFYKHIHHPIQPEEVIRQRYETLISVHPLNKDMDDEAAQRRAEGLKGLMRRDLAKQQQRAHRPERESFKSRVQIDGHSSREDRVWIESGRPDRSIFIRTQDQHSSYNIIDSTRTVLQTIRPVRKGFLVESDASNTYRLRRFSTMLYGLQQYVGSLSRAKETPQIIPDSDRIAHFRKTGTLGDGSELKISQDTKKPDRRVVIEIVKEGAVQVMAVADATDFSRVYEFKTYRGLTGQLVLHQ
jgi:hypothetical protein